MASRRSGIDRNAVFLVYLGSIMIPFVVLMVPLFQEVVAVGWNNRMVALVVPFIFSAYGTFLMRQFFMTLPVELEEAAFIDGASRARIVWRILVPLASPRWPPLPASRSSTRGTRSSGR